MFGIKCHYCGHCESVHELMKNADTEIERKIVFNANPQYRTLIEGYAQTLEQCEEYMPEDRKLAEELARELYGHHRTPQFADEDYC